MPSQHQRAHLVRRAQAAPPSPPRTSPVSHPARPNPNLIRRVVQPISTPHTSSQTLQSNSDEDDEDENENNNEDQEDEESGQKRKRGRYLLRDALEEEVNKKKRKRGIVKNMQRGSTLKPYKKAGRWIVRIFGPWIDLNEAFRIGLAEDGFFELSDECDEMEDIEEQKDAYLKLYRGVLALVPNFKKTIEEFGDDFESIMDLIGVMEKESQSARQQDTNKMKEGLWEFFAHDETEVACVPKGKTGRGFNHIGTARALCPRAYIGDFDNVESFLEKITSGDIEITADQFPNFLYDENNADLPEEGVEWDVENGLLTSSLCIWAYKCIFMGNGFWSSTEKKKKSPVGKINGLTQVTPATIAYAVAQARFALSSCEEWGVEDGQFILQEFYEAILELFEDEEDEWVIKTLAWWNKQIFPNELGSKNKRSDNNNAEPDTDSIRSKAKHARLERAKERRQQAAEN